MSRRILILILVGVFTILIFVFLGFYSWQKTAKERERGFLNYSNSFYSDYTISYPRNMNVSEVGQNNQRAIITAPEYKIDMATGEITAGFKIDIYVDFFNSLDDLFYCNKEELDIKRRCLLSSQGLDYQKGEVTVKKIKMGEYPGIKYEFISNGGKNNNIGIVTQKDGKYYLVLIAYRNFRNMDLFNKILDSFKLVTKSTSLPEDFNLYFSFGVEEGNLLDTKKNLYVKDMIRDPDVNYKVILSDKERAVVYDSVVKNNFFDLKSEMISSEAECSPTQRLTLSITMNQKTHTVKWTCGFPRDDPDYTRLEEITIKIKEIISQKEKEMGIPQPKGGYL